MQRLNRPNRCLTCSFRADGSTAQAGLQGDAARGTHARCLAGFGATTSVMNLPGSRGGVRDGLQILDHLLAHLLEQRAGGAGETWAA